MLKFRHVFVVTILFGLAGCGQAEAKGDTVLTPEEKHVIEDKGTERAFSGKYWDNHEDGTYTCKRCGAPLFDSDTKFESGTGWPSFDDTLPGAVKEIADADGRRTEIVCAKCDAHLGHVFRGEGMTEKSTRHCVNSISLNFEPGAAGAEMAKAALGTEKEAKAIFAGGCFWGVEYFFEKADGVISTDVGYTGGHVDNPTYKQICAGDTGHVEAIEVTYNPEKTTYEEMAKLFFETHDPTQVDRQGPDHGYQYRSMIFYMNDEEKAVAEKLIQQLEEKGLDVATEIAKAEKFWPAEDYHQNYYDKKNGTPYCHAYTKRF